MVKCLLIQSVMLVIFALTSLRNVSHLVCQVFRGGVAHNCMSDRARCTIMSLYFAIWILAMSKSLCSSATLASSSCIRLNKASLTCSAASIFCFSGFIYPMISFFLATLGISSSFVAFRVAIAGTSEALVLAAIFSSAILATFWDFFSLILRFLALQASHL